MAQFTRSLIESYSSIYYWEHEYEKTNVLHCNDRLQLQTFAVLIYVICSCILRVFSENSDNIHLSFDAEMLLFL